jgi:hypothetical protein
MEIAMFLLIAAGQFCLLSYWLKAGILAISQRLSYTLLELP